MHAIIETDSPLLLRRRHWVLLVYSFLSGLVIKKLCRRVSVVFVSVCACKYWYVALTLSLSLSLSLCCTSMSRYMCLCQVCVCVCVCESGRLSVFAWANTIRNACS